MARHNKAKNHIELVLREIGTPATWPQIKETWFNLNPRSYIRLCPTSGQVGSTLASDPRFTQFGKSIIRPTLSKQDVAEYNLWGLTEWLAREG